MWLERRGHWYHYRSVPYYTGGNDIDLYTLAGDSVGINPAEGVRLMMEEGQEDNGNNVYFTVDDYRRLECDLIQ